MLWMDYVMRMMMDGLLERLGPGGLDPVEVFESLPEVCRDGVWG